MARTERSTVVGVFRDQGQARDAIGALKDAGFAADDIGILTPDRGETRAMAEETGSKAGAGAATGAAAGGVLGGLGGWLAGIGALAIPGIGPFVAAGALATALGGAAVGAGVGAIGGALTGMGVRKEEADWYEQEVRGGGTLVTVRADGRYDEAQGLLRRSGAYDIETREAGAAGRSTGGKAPAGQAQPRTTGQAGERIELSEEELRARTETAKAGEVGVRKDVVTEQRTMDVPVTREEVDVQRRPVERRPTDRPIGEGEEIRVPVQEEKVRVEKEPVVKEEIDVGKRQVQETEQVSGTVRREEARVESEGDVERREGEPRR